MTFPLSLVARVQDGTTALSQGQRERLARYLKAHEGRFVQITVREQGRPRSPNQNRYLWLVYGMIADETGHTSEEVHEWCKSSFLPRAFVTIAGTEREVAKSTTALSTGEMEEYLERIRAFAAAELGVAIPLPNEAP